jgi:hypothetical protein
MGVSLPKAPARPAPALRWFAFWDFILAFAPIYYFGGVGGFH